TSWLVDNSALAAVSNTDATTTAVITIAGGFVGAFTRAIGDIHWWLDGETLRVLPSGTTTDPVIQWAIDAATAGDTIKLAEGTYTETIVFDAAADAVTLRGDSTDKVIITMANADTVQITDCGA
ncbi:unnamed protein product, partial [marine sediment metagenome]